jgi:hypothetical protein
MLVHGVGSDIDSFNIQLAFAETALTNFLSAAHRTLIVRKLKGLEEFIPFTSVHWHMGEKGMSYP